MSKFSSGTQFEVLSATAESAFGTSDVDVSANRWSKHGYDRLYLNDDSKLSKYKYYIDLEDLTVHDAPKSTYADNTDIEIDGDTATLDIIGKWHLVIRAAGTGDN